MTNGQLEMTTMRDDEPTFDQAPSVRYDALPENVRYRDEGCDLSPSCLNCRLPVCRYDHPGGTRRLRTLGRDEEIVRLRRRERVPVDVLANRYNISRRTVFRILRRCRAATPFVACEDVGSDLGGHRGPPLQKMR